MALTALITNTAFLNHPFYFDANSYNVSKLNDIILYEQERLLRKILGDTLYIAIDADWTGTAFTTQKWTDFVDGYSFVVSGKTIKWAGFKDMLKYFVYYEYTKYNFQHSTPLGNVTPGMENGTISFDANNAVKMWNKGVTLYGYDYNNLFAQLWYEHCTFSFSNSYLYEPTAYNFLLNRISEFPNWEFKNEYKINEFF